MKSLYSRIEIWPYGKNISSIISIDFNSVQRPILRPYRQKCTTIFHACIITLHNTDYSCSVKLTKLISPYCQNDSMQEQCSFKKLEVFMWKENENLNFIVTNAEEYSASVWQNCKPEIDFRIGLSLWVIEAWLLKLNSFQKNCQNDRFQAMVDFKLFLNPPISRNLDFIRRRCNRRKINCPNFSNISCVTGCKDGETLISSEHENK